MASSEHCKIGENYFYPQVATAIFHNCQKFLLPKALAYNEHIGEQANQAKDDYKYKKKLRKELELLERDDPSLLAASTGTKKLTKAQKQKLSKKEQKKLSKMYK